MTNRFSGFMCAGKTESKFNVITNFPHLSVYDKEL